MEEQAGTKMNVLENYTLDIVLKTGRKEGRGRDDGSDRGEGEVRYKTRDCWPVSY